MTDGRTIEVDIMTLFNQIDHKLDNMVTLVALKADASSLLSLQEKIAYIEINGSNNARAALLKVEALEERIHSLAWRVVFAIGSAILAVAGTIALGLMKLK